MSDERNESYKIAIDENKKFTYNTDNIFYEKSADEMFEELGYEKKVNVTWIKYKKIFSYNTQTISFFDNGIPRDRIVSIEQGKVAKKERKEHSSFERITILSIEELQAIN